MNLHISWKAMKRIKILDPSNKIYLLEAIEDLTGMTKIEDIIRKGNYQDLEVKQENGKVVSIKRTIKKMID
jgi:hypothetical protein